MMVEFVRAARRQDHHYIHDMPILPLLSLMGGSRSIAQYFWEYSTILVHFYVDMYISLYIWIYNAIIYSILAHLAQNR